ncbi:hypothetical protein CDL12_22591 [Handroanthus impetiginosus]|uniref:Uncharacterized protein n=1 Tax=Handroanthus impetiginosus TaxID=429701 RepID=A0A2G9GHW4_9LAMI|nr:hypothetical protein CDL12_22591 [Handroanthus impetiginosus]
MENKRGSGVIYTKDAKEKTGITMENPFTLKVGQVFTGFGIGCGIGIGVGRPLNLGAIPFLNQAMVATRGATDAFSGLQRHVNGALRKVGAKNIEAGIGCGVGFGHGFGVGLAVKPRVLHQIQSNLLQLGTHVMMKLGIGSSSVLPASLQTGMNMVKEPSHGSPVGTISPLVKSVSNSTDEGDIRAGKTQVFTDEGDIRAGKTQVLSEEILASKGAAVKTQYSSRTEAVIDKFLKNPLLKEETGSLREQVLKHQVLIEELMQENEKLRQILVDELKVQPSKLQSSFTRSKSSCTECFECRRKQRRR